MQKLLCHPDTPANNVESVSAEVKLSKGGHLWMRYHVACTQPKILLAEHQEPLRTDFLWKHTCFETFITRADQSNYIEFNFCPSSRWAAYQFTDYREGAADLPVDMAPQISLDVSESHVAIEAKLILPEAWREGEMLMGITTIVEDEDESLSYWAIKHPAEKQEFHDRSCFIHPLSAA